MKKTFKIKLGIIVTIVVFIIVISLIIITLDKKQIYQYFLTNIETYYLSNEDSTIDINIYSSQEDNMYLNTKTIDKCEIKDNDTGDFYILELKQIVEEDENIVYDNQKLYKYRVSFVFPFNEIDGVFQLNNVFLNISYKSSENINLPIGSIIYYQIEDNSSKLRISRLRGIVNQINNISILTGVGMTFESDENILIKRVESLDQRIHVQNFNITRTTNTEYDNSSLINEIIGIDYDINNFDKRSKDIELLSSEDNHYILPLSYYDINCINKVGFRVIYTINEIEYLTIVYPFKFFNSSTMQSVLIKYEAIANQESN